MKFLHQLKESTLHLAFPHVCAGCGSDLPESPQLLCLRCNDSLPATNFHLHSNNPVEKLFWGRLPLLHGTAQYYFTKESMIQHLMHQFKYNNRRDIGLYLGNLMGRALASTNRFSYIDAMVPLPLFAGRQKKRGYNQAAVLCDGISEVLEKPVWKKIINRNAPTESQTKKGRVERWLNVEGRFELVNPEAIENSHILLVDDVITTGATIEACARELMKAKNLQLSIATLCFSSH